MHGNEDSGSESTRVPRCLYVERRKERSLEKDCLLAMRINVVCDGFPRAAAAARLAGSGPAASLSDINKPAREFQTDLCRTTTSMGG